MSQPSFITRLSIAEGRSHLSLLCFTATMLFVWRPRTLAEYAITALWFPLQKFIASGPVNKHRPNLRGKVAIVTGGISGIGFETVKGLLQVGATVIVGCRLETIPGELPPQEAKRRLEEAVPGAQVHIVELDLANTASVRRFVADFDSLGFGRLDILINNAGVFSHKQRQAPRCGGVDIHAAVNFISPALLTDLLLPALKKSRGRIIFVNSNGQRKYTALIKERVKEYFTTALPNAATKYKVTQPYAMSKLGALQYVGLLAKQLAPYDVPVVALHPGVIISPLFRDFVSPRLQWIVFGALGLILKSCYHGAQTTLHCAMAPKLETGAFYIDNRVANAFASPRAHDNHEATESVRWARAVAAGPLAA